MAGHASSTSACDARHASWSGWPAATRTPPEPPTEPAARRSRLGRMALRHGPGHAAFRRVLAKAVAARPPRSWVVPRPRRPNGSWPMGRFSLGSTRGRGGLRMAGFRDTLNLPRTEFPMKAELPKREPERLRWWRERNVYDTLRQRRAGAPLWLLHDGPPYSNGHIHMGTAANYVWKDAVIRAATILGHDASFLPGWDNHGMPIEIHVSKEFRARGERPDRLTLRRRCRDYAAEWVDKQSEDFRRLGVWGEWEHPYLTMDRGFEAAIIDTFAGLAGRGYVQRGLRSIHWCPTDRTALAEAEIEYADDPSPSVFVRFPLRRDPTGVLKRHPGVAAVAWTTTPWTLPANRGLMVDPTATYVVVAADGGEFLVAEARLESVAAAAGWNQPAVRARVRGADLVGVTFVAPWGNDSPVVDGTPFVSLEDGTGLVHLAPGHGKEDFAVGQRNGLEIACPVDEAGRFTAEVEPFVGRQVLDVNDDVILWLRKEDLVVSATTFTHADPHCSRC